MKKISLFLITMPLWSLIFAMSVMAYGDVEHKKNLKDKKYKKNYIQMEEVLKNAEATLHPELFQMLKEEQDDWFKGFINDDFEGAEENIDAMANMYMELEGLSEQEAYAEAVEYRTKELEVLVRQILLLSCVEGKPGIYKLSGTNKDGVPCISVLEVHKSETGGVDLILTLNLLTDEGTAEFAFIGSGSTEGTAYQLLRKTDDGDELEDKSPLHLSFDGDQAIVVVDEAFKKNPNYRGSYSQCLIDGTYERQVFTPKK